RLSPEALGSEARGVDLPKIEPGKRLSAQETSDIVSQAIPSSVPKLTGKELGAQADPEAAKEPLREGTANEGGVLALAVIDAKAVVTDETNDNGVPRFGAYQLYVKPKLKDSVQSTIRRAITESIREARLENAGLSPDQVNALTRVDAEQTKEITEEGERDSVKGL